MNEAELRKAYEAEKPALEAWGRFVVQSITDSLKTHLGPDRPIQYFLKLWPVEPRVKETKSFVAKALRRGKNYGNPLKDIADKVGVRFVVLLLPEIRIIERAIVESTEWVSELARDFADERLQKPLHFDYQSLHYVVRSTATKELESVVVPEGTPCEVQVRTLLQHAYSELAHDTIYKPKSFLEEENPELSREVARSMALIETSDMIFEQVAAAIKKAGADLQNALAKGEPVYRSMIGQPKMIDSRLAEFILAPFQKSVPLVTEADLRGIIDAHPHLVEFVKANLARSSLYETPLILIIFWLIEDDEDKVWRNWSADPAVLEEIFAQLGLSTERY